MRYPRCTSVVRISTSFIFKNYLILLWDPSCNLTDKLEILATGQEVYIDRIKPYCIWQKKLYVKCQNFYAELGT